MALLLLKDVNVAIAGAPILRDITMSVDAGRVLGVIGESGSGKSMTALAIMGLLPNGASLKGHIEFDETLLSELPESKLCDIRGDDIGMVFQEPMTALNPVHSIGQQVIECIRLHQRVSRAEAVQVAEDTLTLCGLPPAEFPLSRFPHELSGGQRQRVVIAMAVALKPKLLIADEPTTALDVTTQAEILQLLRSLQQENNMAVMLISHDLAVVADMADDVVIMKSGAIVEQGPLQHVFAKLSHPYTQALFKASDHVPKRESIRSRATMSRMHGETDAPLLEVVKLVCEYPMPRRHWFKPAAGFRAVDDVSFSVNIGESVGLVGESGCGKSTLSRALLGLMRPSAGQVVVRGRNITRHPAELRNLQIVFQDPYGSFNPRHKVARLVAEPLNVLSESLNRATRRKRIDEMLERVGLDAADANKYIHEFSGGQRQRIAIARALIVQPALILLDEAVSALDVSVRATVLDLLADLASSHGLAYLFISHDLSVVRRVTDRVLVMRGGKIVERGDTNQVFDAPNHEYTKRLVASIPLLPEYDHAFIDPV